MYSTYNEGKSVVAEKLRRTLKGEILKKMGANDSKSDVGYLNKLVDECNNNYHRCIFKQFIHADYFGLCEEFESSQKKPPKFKDGERGRVRITKYKNF